ncbi:MAG: DUF308 domain-containing protein [Firmicutes bacterium]|nr:DUF308 domain-containing protein [Bacillota bacterium]
MRMITVAAGMLLSIIGAFCFIFSGYSFSSIAFVVGMAMLLAGALETASWIVSGRVSRLPDTLLVEGIVTALFGFSVLNDQVPDALVAMFFGSLTAISGATRVSQSFAVSRYRPRDWAKVMAFAVMVCLFGVVMMMPVLVSAASPMILVGASFILNGLSLLVYAMYMEGASSEKAEEARARRAAKAAAAEQKKKEREYMNSLSRKERAEAQAEKKRLRREAEEQRREERRLRQEARQAASRTAAEETISLSDEDVEKIKKAADELGFTDSAAGEGAAAATAVTAAAQAKLAASEQAAASNTEDPEQEPSDAADAAEALEIAGTDPKDAVKGVGSETAAAAGSFSEPSFWPEFRKPEDIPRLRTQSAQDEEIREPETAAEEPLTIRKAVSLEEIEAEDVDLAFDDIVLPPADTKAEGGEAWKRLDILREIDSKKGKKEEYRAFTGLKEGELSSAKQRQRLSDEGIFDQKLSFDALDPNKADPEGR